jgi:hypothetical protein
MHQLPPHVGKGRPRLQPGSRQHLLCQAGTLLLLLLLLLRLYSTLCGIVACT